VYYTDGGSPKKRFSRQTGKVVGVFTPPTHLPHL
jgi:hypothetical protein